MIRKPKMVKIEKKVEETRAITSLYFHYSPWGFEKNDITPSVPFTPGQFFMVWVPQVDEIPISVSFFDPPNFWGITIKNVGEASGAICNLNVGEKLGIRGPLGKGFTLDIGQSIFLGGGVGLAPLRPAYLAYANSSLQPIVVNCAPCGEDLLYHAELEELAKNNVIIYDYATEDGSCGCQGLGTDLFRQVLDATLPEKTVEFAACCGPERMIVKTLEIVERYGITNFQASLERMMRCGMGLCGLCVLDPTGLRVCSDGPVFNGETLHSCTDFGQKVREFSGFKRDL